MKYIQILLFSIILFNCKEPNNESTNILYANVYPSITVRTGPSLNNSVLRNLPFKTEVILVSKEEGSEQSILGVSGNWCKISFQGITAWAFCPLLVGDKKSNGYIVANGKLVPREVEDGKDSKKCIENMMDFKNFNGGCLNNVCSICYGQKFLPDGELVELESTPGGCFAIAKGKWRIIEPNRIKTNYKLSITVHATDAYVPPESEEYKKAQKESERFGKSSGEINVEQIIELNDSHVSIKTEATDPAKIEGKEDIGKLHLERIHRLTANNSGRDIKNCFYPYTPIEYDR